MKTVIKLIALLVILLPTTVDKHYDCYVLSPAEALKLGIIKKLDDPVVALRCRIEGQPKVRYDVTLPRNQYRLPQECQTVWLDIDEGQFSFPKQECKAVKLDNPIGGISGRENPCLASRPPAGTECGRVIPANIDHKP